MNRILLVGQEYGEGLVAVFHYKVAVNYIEFSHLYGRTAHLIRYVTVLVMIVSRMETASGMGEIEYIGLVACHDNIAV